MIARSHRRIERWHTRSVPSNFLVVQRPVGKVGPPITKDPPMHVWIFAISAVFTPVIEPLGITAPSIELPPLVEPELAEPSTSMLDDMRYPGIERMFARLEADQ